MSADPSHASWPHRQLRRGPQWQGSHAYPPPVGGPHHTFRGLIRGLHRGPQWQGSDGYPLHVGRPLIGFVAPWGAPPRAPVAGFAC
eukprot:1356654-Pyramimonas_sp.AAC.1